MNEARDHGTTLIYRCGGRRWRRRGLRDGGGTNGKGEERARPRLGREQRGGMQRRQAATRATAARREAATRAMAARHGGGGVGERARATRQGTRMRPRPTALRKEAVGGILGVNYYSTLHQLKSIKTNTKGRHWKVLEGIGKYFQAL